MGKGDKRRPGKDYGSNWEAIFDRTNNDVSESTKEETKLVGHIGVDAGLCWIGDPCYLTPDGKETPLNNWQAFCDSLEMDEPGPTMKSLNYPGGHEGLGVCVSTGFGDGFYPVHAVISDEDGWGKRIKSVTITFIKDE